jgi:hypothetical protein
VVLYCRTQIGQQITTLGILNTINNYSSAIFFIGIRMLDKINAMNLSSFNQEIWLLVQLEINSVVS